MQSSQLSSCGEYVIRAFEARYREVHLPESIRQLRLCFLFTILLSLLFLISDWRFYGQRHFYFAVAARMVTGFISAACIFIVSGAKSFRQYELTCIGWAAVVIPACTVLVTPQTDIALLVTFILPACFYLAIPASFRLSILLGSGCSAVVLGAYLSSASWSNTSLGLVLAMVMSNVVLALILRQSKRLRRLEWSAAQAERLANDRLSVDRDMLEKMLKAIPTPLVITASQTGRILQANEAANDYFGSDLLDSSLSIDNYIDRKDAVRLAVRLRSDGQVSGFETRLHLVDGSSRDVLLAVTMVTIGGIEALLSVFVDITQRKEVEAIMERLATTDPLSGLPNRGRFFTVASEEVKRAHRFHHPLAVLMIDIDYFKRINDTHGHKAGDVALQSFAELCRAWARKQDTVARLGGEEFGLLLPEVDSANALMLAERLRMSVEGFRMERLMTPITISIGISEVLPGETTVDAALSRADQALYAAKKAGRNRAVLYDRAVASTQFALRR